MTSSTISHIWSRLRPWVWPSSEDLNPSVRDIDTIRIDSLNERVRQIEANERVDWTKIDAYYVRMASQSFMEHMNRVQVELQSRHEVHSACVHRVLDEHRADVAESIESLNSRLASAETLCGEEIAKLQLDCQKNTERLATLLQQLKFIGGGA